MTTNTIKSKAFFVGGNATFTVSSPDHHFTFRIKRGKSNQYFCSAMTGSDNDRHYTYMGMLFGGVVNRTKGSKLHYSDIRYKVINWVIHMVSNNKKLKFGYKIQHDGKCASCGRKLTNPESIDRGFGPTCYNSSEDFGQQTIYT